MEIIQQPESLSLSGNVKNFILSGLTESVEFVLTCDAVEILRENYEPIGGKVEIPVKLVIDELLKISIPNFDIVTYEQTNAVKTFSALVDTQTITFTVIKGGFSALESSPVFLKSNFLTWQPQQKFLTSTLPEFLSYYTQSSGNLKIKGYFSDKTSDIHTIVLEGSKFYTFNLNWGIVNGYFSKQVLYYDVWVEDPAGNRLSYIQRYVLSPKQDNQQIYLFQNSVGGIDTVLFSGLFSAILKTEGNLSTIKDETTDSDIDMSCVYMQNTGFLPSKDYAEWLRDFFVSPQRFHVADSARRIFIEESENKFETDNLNAYEFEFRYAKETKYNNIIRNREPLPELLEFPVADELFFLAPRLNEFPLAAIADDLVLPVQYAFENTWRRISVDAITRYVLGYAIDNIETVIDLTNYWKKTELVREDLYLKFLDKKISAGYADKAEDSVLWNGKRFTDYIDQPLRTGDDVSFNIVRVKEDLYTPSISSPDFSSGLLGSGFKFENGYGELTGLRLREYLYTPEIIKNKILIMSDEFWFSAGGVIDSVESVSGNLFRVTLKQEKDIIEVPFRAGDVLRGNFDTANGFDSVFFEVESIDAGNVYLRSIYAGESEASLADPEGNLYVTENGDYLLVNVPGGPKRFMTLARQGNTTDTTRQGSIYADGINKYIRVLDNVTGKDIAFENIRVQMGDLSGLISPVVGRMSGAGLYGENVYLVGDFYLRNGKNVKSEIDGISVSLVEISTRVTEAEAAVNLTVSRGEYDVFNKKISESVASISQRVSNAESVLNLTVSQTDFNSFSQIASESISSIIQRVSNTEASLRLTVSKTEYDAFSDSVTVSISSISQRVTNATAELDLTVKKDNIIASINASAETLNGSKLRLDADRIEINGNTIIRNKAGMQVDFFGTVGEVFNINNGKFLVDIDGRMVAEDGSFRGSIDALSGTIGILEIQEGILKIKNPAGSSSIISECGIKPNCIKIFSNNPEQVVSADACITSPVYGTIIGEALFTGRTTDVAGIVGIGGSCFNIDESRHFGMRAIGGLKTDILSLGYSAIINDSRPIPKDVSVVYFQLGLGDSGSRNYYVPNAGVKEGHVYFFSNLDSSNPVVYAGSSAYELTNADSFLIIQHVGNNQYRKIFYKK